MSALDMTPEQVAEAARRMGALFAELPPESVALGLCARIKGLGYTATMGNLQAVHAALVEAAKAPPLKELRINDGDATLYGCEATGTDRIATVAGYHLTPAQLRQLATWSLGAADHLDGVEPPGRELHMDQQPHGLMVRTGHLCPAHLRVGSRGFNLYASCDMRRIARKLLDLADAHDAGGAA